MQAVAVETERTVKVQVHKLINEKKFYASFLVRDNGRGGRPGCVTNFQHDNKP